MIVIIISFLVVFGLTVAMAINISSHKRIEIKKKKWEELKKKKEW